MGFGIAAAVEMVRPERFELPTPCFVGKCSIQLSYGRTLLILSDLLKMADSQFLPLVGDFVGTRLHCHRSDFPTRPPAV
jgi:hypothetical protein